MKKNVMAEFMGERVLANMCEDEPDRNHMTPMLIKARVGIYESIRQNLLRVIRAAIGGKISGIEYPQDYFLIVGPTNICNARCVFCRYPQADDEGLFTKGVMSFDLFQRIADEWKSDGAEPHIGFSTLAGEPLADLGLPEKVAYATKIGLSTSMVSNGILLNRNKTFEKLLDAGLGNVHFSICLPGRELYKKIYGVDRYWDVLSGIHNFLLENRRRGEPCTVDLAMRSPVPLRDIFKSDDFKTYLAPFLSKRVHVNALISYDNWSGNVTQEHLSGVMRLRSIPKLNKVPCHSMRSMLMRWDGTLRACGCRYKVDDVDEMILGKYPEQSLRQLATGMEFQRLWNGFYTGDVSEVCKTCTFYNPIHSKHGIL